MAMRTPLSRSDLDALMERAAPLAAGFELLADHVSITDANANIIYANKAVERATGFSRHEIIGKTPGDLWGGKMPKDFYKTMWQAIKIEKKPFVAEVENQRKDGTSYWQEIHISPILDEGGEVKFFIGIEPEITERRKKEIFTEEFLSVLGKQLSDPIATARWLAAFLLRTGEKEGTMSGAELSKLHTIYEMSDSALSLITDLLAAAHVSGHDAEDEKFDLKDEIEAIVLHAEQAYPGLIVDFPKEPGERFPLVANKSFALQIFSNLIMNAAQYADPLKREVRVTLIKEQGDYLVSVENNGLEIAATDQSYIFSKLFRSESAKQLNKKGNGLGLFIVKLIAQKMNWDISFQSPRPGGKDGTAFYVKVPAQR